MKYISPERVKEGENLGVVKGKKSNMKNRQIDKNKTKQIRIDIGYHKLLRIEAAKSGRTIKQVLEEHLSTIFEVNTE